MNIKYLVFFILFSKGIYKIKYICEVFFLYMLHKRGLKAAYVSIFGIRVLSSLSSRNSFFNFDGLLCQYDHLNFHIHF